MPSKKGTSPLLRNYDKIALCVAVVVLALSVVAFVTTKGDAGRRRAALRERLDSFRPAHPETADIQGDVIAVSNLFKRLATPDLVAWTSAPGSAGFFVPETRVWCAKSDCHAPILPTDKVCPVCGTEQPGDPKPDVNADTDGDGMPDLWERKVGLNPHDPADATADPDGDGFDNLAEYLAGTDPTDAKSHPDRLTMLRLEKIEATPLPIRFQSRGMRLPDNHYRCQFNYVTEKTRQNPPSAMIKEGEPIVFTTTAGKVDTGYVFTKMEIKKMERKVAWTTVPQLIEVAFASITRGKKTLVLEEGKAASDSNFKITLVQTVDDTELTIDGEDDVLTLEAKRFAVKGVEMDRESITLASEDGTVEIEISRDKARVTRSKGAVKGASKALENHDGNGNLKK